MKLVPRVFMCTHSIPTYSCIPKVVKHASSCISQTKESDFPTLDMCTQGSKHNESFMCIRIACAFNIQISMQSMHLLAEQVVCVLLVRTAQIMWH